MCIRLIHDFPFENFLSKIVHGQSNPKYRCALSIARKVLIVSIIRLWSLHKIIKAKRYRRPPCWLPGTT